MSTIVNVTLAKGKIRITTSDKKVAYLSRRQVATALIRPENELTPSALMSLKGCEIDLVFYKTGDQMINGICTKEDTIVESFSVSLGLNQLIAAEAGVAIAAKISFATSMPQISIPAGNGASTPEREPVVESAPEPEVVLENVVEP